MMISTERDVVNYSHKWVGVVYFLAIIYGSKSKISRWSKDFCSTWSIAWILKSKVGK
jgi:hypothetical protein